MAKPIFALCAVLTVTFFGTPGRSEDATLPTRMIDFVIEREGDRNRCLILARASVAQIDLDAEPLRFVHTSMR
jgi:hypothetical protein